MKIDAEKLKKEIKRQIKVEIEECHKSKHPQYFKFGRVNALENLIPFIDSLQQEQTEMDVVSAAKAFLDALSKTYYSNKLITDAQIIVKQLLIFLETPSKYNPDAIVEQPEVDFEKELEMMMVSFSNWNLGSDVRKEMPKQKLHDCARILLDLARKKLESERDRTYEEAVLSQVYGEGYKQGKQDVLKDLPKLEKTKDDIDPTIPVMYTLASSTKSYVEYNGYKLCINDAFEKLQKEE